MWRAVDEHGAELDILVQKRRDKAAAKRFFKWVLRSTPVPRKIVTAQQMPLERAMSTDRPEAREKLLWAFPDAKAAHATLPFARRLMAVLGAVIGPGSSFDEYVSHVRKLRDLSFGCRVAAQLIASLYRKQLAARFVAWREFTELAQDPSYAF